MQNANIILLDDDFYYEENLISELVNCANQHNNKGIICYACNPCNTIGEPWGDVYGKKTNYNWVAGCAVLYTPGSFPVEMFDYYDDVMKNEPLHCDECILMPFIYYNKTPIYTIYPNWDHFFSTTKMINGSQSTALHEMFFEKPFNFETNKKNKLLSNICSKLPAQYGINYKQIFKDFVYDKTKQEKLILTLTTWKKRINNIPAVLGSMLIQTKVPDKIVLNLSSEEFPEKENEFTDKVYTFLNEHKDLIIVNWVDGPNIKSWKKEIPTFALFPNDAIVCMDDDFLFPHDLLEKIWNAHVKHPEAPITWAICQNHGFWQHCGCISLDKAEYYPADIADFLKTDIVNIPDEDSFMTFMAVRHGNPPISMGSWTPKTDFNPVEPMTNGGGVNLAYAWAAQYLNDRFENYKQSMPMV